MTSQKFLSGKHLKEPGVVEISVTLPYVSHNETMVFERYAPEMNEN